MDTEPLLIPSSGRRKLSSSSMLCPLPEDGEISIPIPISIPCPSSPSSPSSLKDRLIFGAAATSRSPLAPDEEVKLERDKNDESFVPWCSTKTNLHRSRTAPAMSTINDVAGDHPDTDLPPPRRPAIIRQAFLFLFLYLAVGVVVYTIQRSHFSADETHPVVDALYFCIVTMCTIGYGDITPRTPSAKFFSITFVLVGFGFIDILLSGMVSYVLDLQESLLLGAVRKANHNSYIVDVKKGRMRIRLKVGLALGVVVLCIGVGTGVLRFVERLDWLDAFYLSVMSVTTVGYGDRAFKSMPGRLFAAIWLLVSTLAVARAFLYLAEARVDKRHRMMAKWVLGRHMTVAEFLAADIDHNGYVTKSEFVIYKLKEMGKISEKDVMQVCDKFDRLDTGNCGKITLSDLIESHH
ncbi:two pore potassium channel c-like [Dioscorea cayenensis subsp. rotundata]|uniref:Two pore potassium channel c-like n=1 Tax=Dioscorea cayennensis subsp. rotundata TaxID=55577 RepID=A0AB40B6P0_DIOCR|nr:two pore potassium channel c-like [Dioscorea cayenensis subsp. rotundata]